MTQRDLLARCRTAWRSGATVLLLSDYDGTLVPYAPRPEDARLAADVRQTLADLRDRPKTRVGIVSGRALADVRRMVGLPGVYLAGSGGAELDLLGMPVIDPNAEAGRERLADATIAVRPWLERFPGVWIEEKPFARSIHYRDLSEVLRPRLRAEMHAILAGFTDLRCLDVALAFEIGLKSGWHKGTAVERILEAQGGSLLPVFFGDEGNDLEAFSAVRDRAGIAVGIGPRAPKADLHLHTPDELHALLRRLHRLDTEVR